MDKEKTSRKKASEKKQAKTKKSTDKTKAITGSPDTTSNKSLLTNKNTFFLIVLIVFSLIVLLWQNYKNEIIVATVNGTPITRLQVWKDLEKQGGTQSLDALIVQELIMQEGKKQNITVTYQDITEELINIENTLSAQGTTLEQALSLQRMTQAQLEDQLRYQLTLRKLVENTVIPVSDAEINNTISSMVESGQEDTPELREQIRLQLQQNNESQAMQDYLTLLREGAEVNILNSNFVSSETN